MTKSMCVVLVCYLTLLWPFWEFLQFDKKLCTNQEPVTQQLLMLMIKIALKII